MVKKTSATKLRENLFDILTQVQNGASVTIERDGKIVARLVPAHTADWRAGISEQPKLLVSARKAFAPMEDLFEE